jgi:hypothetical protein
VTELSAPHPSTMAARAVMPTARTQGLGIWPVTSRNRMSSSSVGGVRLCAIIVQEEHVHFLTRVRIVQELAREAAMAYRRGTRLVCSNGAIVGGLRAGDDETLSPEFFVLVALDELQGGGIVRGRKVLFDALPPMYQRKPSNRIFGVVNRHGVLHSVTRVCAAAGVPAVPAHGLQGTHARLDVEAGISGDVVAASLGHERFATTAASYADADAPGLVEQSTTVENQCGRGESNSHNLTITRT